MAAILARQLKTTRNRQKELQQLSPFELKDNLIHLAKEKPAPERRLNLKGGKTGCAAIQVGAAVALSRVFRMNKGSDGAGHGGRKSALPFPEYSCHRNEYLIGATHQSRSDHG